MTPLPENLPDTFALDTETTGVEWTQHKPFGFSIAWRETENNALNTLYIDERENENCWEWLRDKIIRAKKIYLHNAKFDMHMLLNKGVYLNGNADGTPKANCTLINASLINEHLRSYSLNDLGLQYVGIGKTETRKEKIESLQFITPDLIRKYAERDAELTLRLAEWQAQEIGKQELKEAQSLEMELLIKLISIERHGIKIDTEKIPAAKEKIKEEIAAMRFNLHDLTGFNVNVNSNADLLKVFKPKMENGQYITKGGAILKATAKGNVSFSAEVLENIIKTCPLTNEEAETILNIRQHEKLLSTFLENHVEKNLIDDRLYPNINQARGEFNGAGTVTGRLSIDKPALQQIPARNKAASQVIKSLFLPDDYEKWAYCDMSQFEFRVYAHYLNDERINNAYEQDPDLDFHSEVARITGLPRNPSEGVGKANAKQINLALKFGFSEGSLCEVMGLPTEQKTFTNRQGQVITYKIPGKEGRKILDNYYKSVGNSKVLIERIKSVARERGYLRTLRGRRIRFPAERLARLHGAAGILFQAQAAEMNKQNIISICDILDRNKTGSLLLNVHDEYNISIEASDAGIQTLHQIKRRIENDKTLRIPLKIDFNKPAANWHCAIKADKL